MLWAAGLDLNGECRMVVGLPGGVEGVNRLALVYC